MAGIHQTLKEARSLYAEALKLQEAVLASHRDLKGLRGAGRDIAGAAQASGRGFLALVFMIGTLAGTAGGFLALLAVRLASGAD